MENFIVQAVYDELKERLVGQRLGKVYQLNATDCAFDFHLGDGSWLFISTRPSDPHIYLTHRSIKSLEAAATVSPQFAMVLRKHLNRAVVVALRKPPTERVIEFELSNYGADGETRTLYLIADLMGRSANLYLLNSDRRVIDKLKYKKDESLGLVIGLEYSPPNLETTIDDMSDEELERVLAESQPLSSKLKDRLPGFGPLLIEELIYRTRAKPLTTAIREIADEVWHRKSHSVVYGDNSVIGKDKERLVLSSIEFKCKSALQAKRFETVLQAAAYYYNSEREAADLAAKVAAIRAKLKSRLDKIVKLDKNLRSDLSSLGKEADYKRYGDLLLANIVTMERVGEMARVIDLYDPEQRIIDIPLDSNLLPQAGAERYFKLYQKARRGRQEIEKRLIVIERDIQKLKAIVCQLDQVSSEDDLSDISAIVDPTKKKSLKRRESKDGKDGNSETKSISGVRVFQSSDGYEIWVGQRQQRQRQPDVQTGASI